MPGGTKRILKDWIYESFALNGPKAEPTASDSKNERHCKTAYMALTTYIQIKQPTLELQTYLYRTMCLVKFDRQFKVLLLSSLP